MSKQLYFEDIEVGSEVTPLAKIATTKMLVRWAGASGDFNPLHYEDKFAEAQGVGSPIVHGQLKRAWLVQMMVDWIGELGDLKKLSCQFRAMDYPVMMKNFSEPVENEPTNWCKGKVVKKGREGENHFVECEIWVENRKGEKTTPGKAVVFLPSKGE